MPRTMPPVRLRRRLFTAPTFSLGLPVADRRGGRLSNAAKGCAGSPWGSRGWGLPGRGPWRRRVLEGAGPLIACQHALLLVHDPVPVEDRAARVSGEEPRPSFRDTRSSQGPPGVASSGAPSRPPRRSSPMIGRRWGPCGRWPRQLPDAKDGRLRAGCGAAPLAHRAGVVRVGLRLGSSERDPVIAGGAGFTEGVVRERHGDGASVIKCW